MNEIIAKKKKRKVLLLCTLWLYPHAEIYMFILKAQKGFGNKYSTFPVLPGDLES